MSYQPRATVNAFDIARLPFPEAQRLLAAAGRDGKAVLTTLGWHGTAIDPRTLSSSFAVVQAGGVLDGLVGRRLRVTPRVGGVRAPLYVYVVASSSEIPDPLTVTRRAFQQFALLSEDAVPVTVEVLP